MVDDAVRGFLGDDEQVSTVKVGDRVRVSCGKSVVVGTVTGVSDNGIDVKQDKVDAFNFFSFVNWVFNVIAPPIPDVVGTIVRDKAGDVWQRREKGWYIADDDADFYDINCLDQDSYAPFSVLYAPENSS